MLGPPARLRPVGRPIRVEATPPIDEQHELDIASIEEGAVEARDHLVDVFGLRPTEECGKSLHAHEPVGLTQDLVDACVDRARGRATVGRGLAAQEDEHCGQQNPHGDHDGAILHCGERSPGFQSKREKKHPLLAGTLV
jgi:hypothetical protein